MGNDDFTSVSDYNGGFKSLSATVANHKSYISWSGSCIVAGVGKETQMFSISYSETEYTRIAGEDGFTDDFYSIPGKAKSIAKTIPFPG